MSCRYDTRFALHRGASPGAHRQNGYPLARAIVDNRRAKPSIFLTRLPVRHARARQPYRTRVETRLIAVSWRPAMSNDMYNKRAQKFAKFFAATTRDSRLDVHVDIPVKRARLAPDRVYIYVHQPGATSRRARSPAARPASFVRRGELSALYAYLSLRRACLFSTVPGSHGAVPRGARLPAGGLQSKRGRCEEEISEERCARSRDRTEGWVSILV